jgi:nitrogen fixation protein FixH
MIWRFVPAVLLTLMVGGLVLMAVIAADDPSFAIEKNYYQKAIAWDAHRLQESENNRLGWKLEASIVDVESGVELALRLEDRDGQPIRGARLELEAFHNARAAEVLSVSFNEQEIGYRARLPIRRSGLWELRFVAVRGADRFTLVERREIEVAR